MPVVSPVDGSLAFGPSPQQLELEEYNGDLDQPLGELHPPKYVYGEILCQYNPSQSFPVL